MLKNTDTDGSWKLLRGEIKENLNKQKYTLYS